MATDLEIHPNKINVCESIGVWAFDILDRIMMMVMMMTRINISFLKTKGNPKQARHDGKVVMLVCDYRLRTENQ